MRKYFIFKLILVFTLSAFLYQSAVFSQPEPFEQNYLAPDSGLSGDGIHGGDEEAFQEAFWYRLTMEGDRTADGDGITDVELASLLETRLQESAAKLPWWDELVGIPYDDPRLRFLVHLGQSVEPHQGRPGSSTPRGVTRMLNHAEVLHEIFEDMGIQPVSIPLNLPKQPHPSTTDMLKNAEFLRRAIFAHPRIISVTTAYPHKRLMDKWPQSRDDHRPIGLTNTDLVILRDTNGRAVNSFGTNVDAPPFITSYKTIWGLEEGQSNQLDDKHVVILGGLGGFGHSLTTAMAQEHPASITISVSPGSINHSRPQQLSLEKLMPKGTVLNILPSDHMDLSKALRQAHVIINATGIGAEDDRSPIEDPSVFSREGAEDVMVFDLVYRTLDGTLRLVTPFLQQAWDQGIRNVHNGAGLLVSAHAWFGSWLVSQYREDPVDRDDLYREIYFEMADHIHQTLGIQEARAVLLQMGDGLGRRYQTALSPIKIAGTGLTGDSGAGLARFMENRSMNFTALIRDEESKSHYRARSGQNIRHGRYALAGLFDRDEMRDAIREHNVFYHFAGLIGSRDQGQNISINGLAAIRLIKWAEELNPSIRFVHASSIRVLNLIDKQGDIVRGDVKKWINEALDFVDIHWSEIQHASDLRETNRFSAQLLEGSDYPEGVEPYDLSKLLVDEYLKRSLKRGTFTNFVSVRISSVYGAGMLSGFKDHQLLIEARLRNQRARVPKKTRDHIHVDDLAEIFWNLGTQDYPDLYFMTATSGDFQSAEDIWRIVLDHTPELEGRGTAEFTGSDAHSSSYVLPTQDFAVARAVLGRDFVDFGQGILDEIAYLQSQNTEQDPHIEGDGVNTFSIPQQAMPETWTGQDVSAFPKTITNISTWTHSRDPNQALGAFQKWFDDEMDSETQAPDRISASDIHPALVVASSEELNFTPHPGFFWVRLMKKGSTRNVLADNVLNVAYEDWADEEGRVRLARVNKAVSVWTEGRYRLGLFLPFGNITQVVSQIRHIVVATQNILRTTTQLTATHGRLDDAQQHLLRTLFKKAFGSQA